ncbi:MAG: DUF559 domain-containing protein [Salinivirgaceae bacterium]|nr:DUF559 domain-containing protein [Salinivirgaceae bacterium]
MIYDSVGTQHFFYISDLYCPTCMLAIELDGKVHYFAKERDAFETSN